MSDPSSPSPHESRPVLDDREARVLGVLIEKELTTPDQYPLTLNALTTGCNQKSNRDPQTSLTEAEVRAAFEGLRAKQLAGGVSGGGRVERFRHNARESWGVSQRGVAILAELPPARRPKPGRATRTRPSHGRPARARRSGDGARRPARARLRRTARSPARLTRRALRPTASGSQPRARSPPLGPDAASAQATPAPAARSSAAGAPSAEPRSPGGPALAERVADLEKEVSRLSASLTKLAESLGESLD